MFLFKIKNLGIAATLVAGSLLQGCSGGGNDNSGPELFSISGKVTGLAGDITVAVNGSEEIISTNGNFTLSAELELNSNYSVRIVNTPENLSCSISNATGVISGDVNNIEISCSGLEGKAYSLNSLAFEKEAPSILTYAFHLVDRTTGRAIEELTTNNVKDYLKVLENDSPVSASESFLEVEQLVGLDAIYTTVFAIDISLSMSADDITKVVNAIKQSISDANGNSTLAPNQSISIFTFDGTVNNLLSNSKDMAVIYNALDSIEVGRNSTNLYGAIKDSAESWQNQVSLDLVSYGSLILFTDGNDTAGSIDIEAAKSALVGKNAYFIAVGDEIEPQLLKALTDESNIFTLDNFDQLSNVLDKALAHAKSYENGLYMLSYATPKRAGSHDLAIIANDDFDCLTPVSEAEQISMSDTGQIQDCSDRADYQFDATGYSDVYPEIKIEGARSTLTPRLTWRLKTRWTIQAPSYEWDIQQCFGTLEMTANEDNSEVNFVRVDDEFTMAKITVTDTNNQVQQSAYLKMSGSELDFELSKNQSNESLCRNR